MAAIALVGLAALVLAWAPGPLDPARAWLILYPPVVIAAYLGGLAPGLLATTLACTVAALLVPATGRPAPAESVPWPAIAIFFVNGCVISLFAELLRRARGRVPVARAPDADESLSFELFENSPTALLLVDYADGRVLRANRNAAALWGYGSTEFTSKNIRELILPEEMEHTQLRRERFLESPDQPLNFEQRFVSKDGRLFWAQIVVVGCRDAKGRTNRLLVSALDVSERRQIQDVSQRERAKALALLRNASDGVHILDRGGNLVEGSDSFFAMLGYSREEMIGMNVSVWDARWDPAEMGRRMERHFAEAGRFEFKTRHRRKDGGLFDVEISGQVIDAGGQKLGYFSSRDISRREADEAALRESEIRFRMLVEGAPQAIFVQTNGRFAYVNQRTLALFGAANKEQLIGQPIMERIHPDNREQVRVRMARTNQDRRETPGIEETYVRLDGSTVAVEVSAVPARFGNERGALVFARDISERRLAEQQQHIAAVAFESQEGMLITNANLVILRVNKAFTQITGYQPEEVIGQTPSLLKSGQHPASFYKEMWDSVRDTGSWRGEIWNRRKSGEIYPEWLTITAVKGDGERVTNYVGTMVDITVHKEAEQRIEHLAFHDQLTALPNRRLLIDRLEQALAASARTERKGALLFLDLDNFKVLNDTSGHDVGDKLLVEVARRLSNCVREGDTVARLGGDEFVIMLNDLSANAADAATQAKAIGEKILFALNQSFSIDQQVLHSTPSIGVTLFLDRHNSVDELLKQADIAMYEAKAAGRNTLRFFNPEMQAALATRAVLEASLRLAIHERQFVLHFQPQVNETRAIVGAEALVRWAHPERGLMSPAHFIGLAEETGLILPIGQWVLEAACARLRAWEHHAATDGLVLAVNVSARQFRQQDFVEQVLHALKNAGARAQRLKIELTESMVLDDVEDTIAKMRSLKAIGVGFSIDDFGTGFSSLSYLTRLPLDQLKIDRSFVQNLPDSESDAVVAQTIITMAKSLGLDVIAEGVETEEQRRFLAERGCPVYQGYLFSKPLPLAQFEQLLAEG